MTTANRPAMEVDIALTLNAADKVREFLKAEQVSTETAGLRVSVTPGGCSGFKYALNIEEAALDDDVITESHDVRLFIDAFSAQYLGGTRIDYVSDLSGNGFRFDNPSATGGCGCGSSFSA